MEDKIVWSHSRINTLMNNPAEYYLSYVEGITPKIEKTALSIGSAIHWGLENETSDLTQYYNEKGNFTQWNNYTDEQCLAECIVDAFLRRKDEIYDSILTDKEDGSKATLLQVERELKLTAHVDSNIYKDGHEFLGIIDLLFLTDKGLILMDYKTSSKDVDWDQYKSQLYKYDFLLKATFPDIPLYKVVIINLKKTNIRRKKNEPDDMFKRRIKDEYIMNSDLINWHEYTKDEFNPEQSERFKKDLSQLIDACRMMIENKLYCLNHSNVISLYGPSQYYDVFYHKQDAQYLYIIRDTIFDEDTNSLLSTRDCEDIDMMVLDKDNILNKYTLFKEEATKIFAKEKNTTKEQLFADLKKHWICSDKLLEKYFLTYQKNF